MHNTLKQQIEEAFGSVENLPKEAEALVKLVSHCYEAYDKKAQQIEELQKVNDFMIDRELVMVELKDENARLRRRIAEVRDEECETE